ncbi:MAG TPA: hypothetical protein VM261_16740 [Kofleriaceae bacterium]|nr:hypothetical protein [Kofleriaceae bacterium]
MDAGAPSRCAAWGYADEALLERLELVANRLGGVLFGLVRSLA